MLFRSVAEEGKEELFIHDIFAKHKVSIDEVIESFGTGNKRVVLGFTPDEKSTYECKKLQEEDTTLFVKGPAFEGFSDRHVMFTPISHA